MDCAKMFWMLFGVTVVLFVDFTKGCQYCGCYGTPNCDCYCPPWMYIGYDKIILNPAQGQVSVSSSAAASVKYNKGAPQAYISSLSSAKADPKVPVVIVRPTVPPPTQGTPTAPQPPTGQPVVTQKPAPTPAGNAGKKGWDYRPGDNAYGPANWKLQWSNCSGLHQSPIDIATVGVIAKQAPWKLQAGNPDPAIAENFIVMGKLINNGRGLGFRVDDVNTPIQLVFNNTYKLRQFHFHFGCEDEMGSEHSLDGKRYPGEIHLIFTNNKYPTVQNALNMPDGIISLAFFLDYDEAVQNKAFKRITDNINSLRQPKNTVPFQDGISLKNMIPAMKEGLENLKVFAYRGSMPAPPCYETFTWLVFRRPVKINPVTLENWRNHLHGNNGRMCGNYRPIQPLNNRKIFTLNDVAAPMVQPINVNSPPNGPTSQPEVSGQAPPVARFRAGGMPLERISAGMREKAFAKLVGSTGNQPDEKVTSADARQELHPAQTGNGGTLQSVGNIVPPNVGNPVREQSSAFTSMSSGKDSKLLPESKKQIDSQSPQGFKNIDNGKKDDSQAKKPTVAPGMKRQWV